jgi:hypothetical protein
MSAKKTTENFIQQARIIHGDRYDYSTSVYKNNHTNVKIICPLHGVFWQSPASHLRLKQGCPVCSRIRVSSKIRKQKKQFIEDAIKVHHEKYDYSKVEYVNTHVKIEIICKKHGSFTQKPCNHLHGQGCPRCGIKQSHITQTLSFDSFLQRAKEMHGEFYEYIKDEYKGSNNKTSIICPKHGVFTQSVHNHLLGQGCPLCGVEKRTKSCSCSLEDFIEKAILVHGETYDYSCVNYINNHSKINIGCKTHGLFKQTPASHLIGQGCPRCVPQVSNWEARLLEYTRGLCPDTIGSYRKWFRGHPKKEIDIFIPSLNLGFECNGIFWHKIKNNYDCGDKVIEAERQGIKLIVLWDDKSEKENEKIVYETVNHRKQEGF